MAYQRIPTGAWFPDPFSPPSLSDIGLIDATGEKLAIVGRVRWKDNAASKNIRHVQFKWGTITKAGGSALTVSLQDVSLTAGPVFQPDGGQDQTVAVANADAGFASTTWYRTGAFSADRAAAHGSLLAVVIEFDGGGRQGADAVRLNADVSQGGFHGSGIAQFTSAWSVLPLNATSNIILEADDGTFGTLDFSRPLATAANETGYNSGSAADETGNAFTLPFACKVDCLWAMLSAASGANFDICLYRGTTLIASVSVDYNTVGAASSSRVHFGTIDDVEIQANVEHTITVKPTTANSVVLFGLTVNDAGHWDLHPGGQAMHYASRVDGGSWNAPVTTKRIFAGMRISQVSDGAALIGHPGMRGGFV